jgi:pimeloyl-ACP methyl ester carboxylesterase
MTVKRFAGRDGVELAYREIGDGRPFVLLHGFQGNGSQMAEHGFVATLAERGHRVILPDLRGHGESARPHDPASYPPDILADDGLALIEHLGLGEYDLGGYSFGARIVLRMLVRGAGPARAIVAGQGLDAIDKSTTRTGGYRRVLTALVNGDTFEPGSPDAEMAHWIAHFGNDPVALGHVLDTHVATSVAALREVTNPTLVAVGDQDDTHSSADELAASLPNARFVRVPGNHFTALISPEFEAAVVAFLQGLVSVPGA